MRIKKISFLFLLISLVVIVLDQYTKYLATQHLGFQHPYAVFSLLNLNLCHNTGASFGFLHTASGWQVWVLAAIAIAVSIFVLIWLLRLQSSDKLLATALSLILGGALGNLWDRLLLGYVIDFIQFHVKDWYFATFNIADTAITIGTILVALSVLFDKGKEKSP